MALHVWSAPLSPARARQMLDLSDDVTPQAWLVGLFQDAAAMCADNDLDRIARAQGQVERWRATVSDSPQSPTALQLDALAATLDAGWRTISLRRDAQEQRAEGATIRERILQFVEDNPSARPRAIAEDLKISPSQVSRALRLLVEDGAIARDAPTGHDRRAVTYTRVAAPVPAVAA